MPDVKSMLSSAEHLSPELIFHRRWWWDPIDMEVFRGLNEVVQRQLVTVSLQTQAAMLKTQAEGLEKMAGALGQR
jgi:hypothetical protein